MAKKWYVCEYKSNIEQISRTRALEFDDIEKAERNARRAFSRTYEKEAENLKSFIPYRDVKCREATAEEIIESKQTW